jgi:hypothetical protein
MRKCVCVFISQFYIGYDNKRMRIVQKDAKSIIVPADHAVITISINYTIPLLSNAQECLNNNEITKDVQNNMEEGMQNE